MRSGPAYDPRCERCSKPREEVAGMIAIHKDQRLPTVLCWDCITDLNVVAEYSRSHLMKE